MIKRLLCISLFFGFLTGARAQSELTLPFLEDVFQSTHTNPAAVPEFRLSIGLPGISSVRAGVTNTGFAINDVIERRQDTLYVSMDKMLGNLKKNNFMYVGGSTDLFHVRLKVKDFFFSLHATEYAEFRFSYPFDFVNFPWKGNGEYLGKKVNWKNLGVDAIHYREYGFGLVHHRDKKPLTYGGRAKLLTGFSNVHVKNKDLGLTTEQDMYRIDVMSDAMVHTSLPNTGDSTGFDPFSYATNFENLGFAIDLGATYRLGKHLDLHLAATNIGFIRWKGNVKNYGLVGGTYFEGFDPVQELYKDTFDIEAYGDSLASYFETTETENPYTTWLVPHFYAAAQYQLAEKTYAGANLFIEPYKSFRPALTVAVTQKVRTILDVVLSYSVQYRSYNNIGMAVMFKPGPVQIYFAGDNLFRTWTNMTVGDSNFTAPLNARTLNFRFGINLVFDRLEQPDKQPLPLD